MATKKDGAEAAATTRKRRGKLELVRLSPGVLSELKDTAERILVDPVKLHGLVEAHVNSLLKGIIFKLYVDHLEAGAQGRALGNKTNPVAPTAEAPAT